MKDLFQKITDAYKKRKRIRSEHADALTELEDLIAETYQEADELDAQGRHMMASRYRSFARLHEIRMTATQLR